jgi:hypothetical protein
VTVINNNDAKNKSLRTRIIESLNTLNSTAIPSGVAKGDLYVFNGASLVRLAVGSNNQVLTADSTAGTGLAWATPTSLVCFDTYVDTKSRNQAQSHHGLLESLATAQPLDSVPTDLTVTAGIGKLVVVVNAGSDTAGSITVTGTSVNRETGAETGADTDTLTVSGTTTDSSAADSNGNTEWAFTNAYITSKWFKGSVTLSTADLTLTDVDVYLVAFEQANDATTFDIETFDVTAFCTNTSGWLDCYLYKLEVSGDTCAIATVAEVHVSAADSAANRSYRLRRGNLATTLDGTSDGFWLDAHLGPLASAYWENINIKVWATVTV